MRSADCKAWAREALTVNLGVLLREHALELGNLGRVGAKLLLHLELLLQVGLALLLLEVHVDQLGANKEAHAAAALHRCRRMPRG